MSLFELMKLRFVYRYVLQQLVSQVAQITMAIAPLHSVDAWKIVI